MHQKPLPKRRPAARRRGAAGGPLARLLSRLAFPIGLAAAVLLTTLAGSLAQERAGVDRARVEREFQAWLDGRVRPLALEAKVSAATFEDATRDVTLDWTLPDLAPPGAPPPAGPQRQTEFADPGRYVAERNFAALITEGREELRRWAKTLDAVERRFGVPREIVVAVWGRESHFGKVRGPHPAVRALATEAFMGARKERFLPELIDALKILEGGHVTLAEMKSSWAGAMGQPQFLPSKYLENAVDMDGDGKRDIWTSVPDTLGSIGHYLKRHGWVGGRDWGVEVRLPREVPCTLEGPDQPKTVADWKALGVSAAGARGLPTDPSAKLSLMAPAGRTGPAFLVSPNFYVLKEYNESDLYALFVGHLADRFRGGTTIQGSWATPKEVARGDVAAMQRRLEAAGHDVGTADGLIGFRTRVAVGRVQEKRGSAPTCYPDVETAKALTR